MEDPAPSSGYIYPMVLLIKRGLVRDRDPKSFFKDPLFTGTHEAALQSVLHGRVDAAASFDKAPEVHLKDPALVARLSIVGETPEIPEAGICARSGLSPTRWRASSGLSWPSRRRSTPPCSSRSMTSTASWKRPTATTSRCAMR